VGYTQTTGHLVFDVKLGKNFRGKARYCAGGYKTGAPASVTYITIVSRDSVRILLTIAALSELEVMSADVQSVFSTAPNKEKCWMVAGPELGSVEVKTLALYGRSYMAEQLSKNGLPINHCRP
jgi:hypothetical protein